MPSKEKVHFAQFRVGILGLVALFFIVLLIFLLTGNMHPFQKTVELHAYVSDAAALTGGAPVRINGIDAGKVKTVTLSGSTDPRHVIRIDFDLHENLLKEIPKDSVASIGSDNLLGSTKFLEIDKGKSNQHVRAGDTIRAVDTREFDDLVQQGYNVLNSLQAILGKVEGIVGQVEVGKGTIGKLLVDETLYNSLQATVNQVQLLSTTLNSKKGTIGRLVNDDTVYNQVQSTIAKVDSIVQSLEDGKGTAGLVLKDRKMYDDLDSSIVQLNTALKNLNAGKGTAGQLLTSNKLGNQVSATLSKVDLTIDKMNSGQGTLGQLLVNPQLYDEATGTTRELHGLLKDFRANPKKFLTIRLHIF